MTIAAALCAGDSFPESSESKPLVAGVASPTDAGRARSDDVEPIQKFGCQNHIDKHNANMKTHILPKRSPSDSSASQQDAGTIPLQFCSKIRIGCFLEIEQSWFAQNYVPLVEKALASSEPHSEPHVGEETAKETCVPRCLARSRD